jgi:hypothetical protein
MVGSRVYKNNVFSAEEIQEGAEDIQEDTEEMENALPEVETAEPTDTPSYGYE